VLLTSLASVVVGVGVVEGAGRVFLALRPSYEVIFLEPDRAVGWKQVPDFRYTWTGIHWFAADFSVPIETNSLGFRDREWDPAKPAGLVRVALLGDSFVEALQVPFERTAAQLLEAKLTARAAAADASTRWEVLNFGISNYSVGQYLLVWEGYARRFGPDFVFAFVSEIQGARTVSRREEGGFRGTRDRSLWIRPTFRVHEGRLIREPARDYEEFVVVQEQVIRREFGGERTRRRESSVLAHVLRSWWPGSAGSRRVDPLLPEAEEPRQIRRINLAILEELDAQVRAAGGSLVIVDASRYFDARSPLPRALRTFSARRRIGYVELSEDLLRANASGLATHWPNDGHLNELGNEIFADALYAWLAGRGAARGSGPSRDHGSQPTSAGDG
jgi:hypothetical protein